MSRSLIVLCVWCLLCGRATAADWMPPEDASEPTVEDVLSELADEGLDVDDPWAVAGAFGKRYAHAIDVDVSELREAEYETFLREVWVGEGGGMQYPWGPPVKIERERRALAQRRLEDPARRAEALLRRLGEMGRAEDIEGLMYVIRDHARTPEGAWKGYAAVLDILAREPIDEIVAARWFDQPVRMASLVRMLEPERAGTLAAAMWRAHAALPTTTPRLPLEARAWLGWSIAHTEPSLALELLRPGLTSTDPTLRLLCGLGIARMTNGPPPYRLTASTEETAAAREKWLADLKPEKPEPFRFPDPFRDPVALRDARGDWDACWLDAEARVVRREEDAPRGLRVLPDGTSLSRLWDLGRDVVGLTGPRGEPYFRVSGIFLEPIPAEHGGFWAQTNGSTVEVGPTGAVLWARRGAVAYGSTPGGHLLLRGEERGTVVVADRRGEPVWSADGLDRLEQSFDHVKSVTPVSPSRLLITTQKYIHVWDREKGRVQSFDGFLWPRVRYQPDGPWVIQNTGNSSVLVLDPATGERHWAGGPPSEIPAITTRRHGGGLMSVPE